jgi:type IX secretion system PorP/SprF family membrane protein
MNQRYILLFTLAVFTVNLTGYAQQEPQFSQSMFYGLTLNPGVAGSENAICATGAFRNQWVGFEDIEGNNVSPETFFVNIMAPIRILRGGVSAQIMQDKIGFEKTISFKVGYAYQRKVGFGKMGIGTQFEFNNRSIDFSKLNPAQEDPLLNQIASNESDMLIDFSLGFYYKVPGSYHIGISGLHLIQSKGKVLAESSSYDLKMKLDRTIVLHGGYEFTFPRNPEFEFHPYAVIRTNLSAVQVDLTGIVIFKELFWAGAGYRVQDAVIFLAGVQYKDFKIGYSYDINVSKLGQPFGGGTHEVMLNYCFKLELDRGRKSYRNTRFL